ncbi:hypothetical protein [Yinghuangia seranimata]|uniref:hypothetical protein n=1 Tax=Yinghuangia seranimata TaxID=408067 RepID=UPI00248C49D8|nr:hypothetical protein [Yinghuangia seranimata]MDI2126209.1 hypothetical protein [Yinghuangia seranimata]
MAGWSRLGRAGLAAARGGNRLRAAAREAERRDAKGATGATGAPGPDADASDVDTSLTAAQAALLLRYIAGRLVLGRLELVFLLKYVLAALGVLLLFGGATVPLGVVLLVLFAVAALVQWMISASVGRLAAFKRLSHAEGALMDATTVWWPNLKRELVRVGLPTRPWALLKLALAFAARRLPADQDRAMRDIRWRGAVLPREQWVRARQVLARAAARETERAP